MIVAETLVQGQRAAAAMVEALAAICAEPEVDVVVLARGGGSFEDLLPFSDERLVRSVAGCPVPVVTAVGHEQDTPLCDLAADRRASTPTAAGRLVVPDLEELLAGLGRSRVALARGARRTLDRHIAGHRVIVLVDTPLERRLGSVKGAIGAGVAGIALAMGEPPAIGAGRTVARFRNLRHPGHAFL